MGMYAPNGTQALFWKTLLHEKIDGEVIFFGDLNSVVNMVLERSRVSLTPGFPQYFWNL